MEGEPGVGRDFGQALAQALRILLSAGGSVLVQLDLEERILGTSVWCVGGRPVEEYADVRNQYLQFTAGDRLSDGVLDPSDEIFRPLDAQPRQRLHADGHLARV